MYSTCECVCVCVWKCVFLCIWIWVCAPCQSASSVSSVLLTAGPVCLEQRLGKLVGAGGTGGRPGTIPAADCSQLVRGRHPKYDTLQYLLWLGLRVPLKGVLFAICCVTCLTCNSPTLGTHSCLKPCVFACIMTIMWLICACDAWGSSHVSV